MLDLAFQTVDYLEQHYNCKPNLITYNMLVEGTVIEKGTKEGLKLLDEMAAKGIIPDYSTYNAVTQGMCKAGRVDEAWRFLARLPARGFKPRAISYCALLQALLESERWTDVDKLIEELFERVCEPRYVHLTEMVNMLCQKEMVDKACLLIDRTEKKWKLKPDTKCQNMVLMILTHIWLPSSLKTSPND
jgi:pentatricopeptide repeat protein